MAKGRLLTPGKMDGVRAIGKAGGVRGFGFLRDRQEERERERGERERRETKRSTRPWSERQREK